MVGALFLAAACSCSHPQALGVATCTTENVVKALKIADKYLPYTPDPGREGMLYYATGGNVVDITMPSMSGYSQEKSDMLKDADELKAKARKLTNEANDLIQKDEDLKFMRKILKACKGD